MLYVFGDSFSHPLDDFEPSNDLRKKHKKYPEFIPIKDNWVNLVSKKLTGSNFCTNDSMAGCANEFIYSNFKQQLPLMKQGDYVIVVLTSSDRRWLIEQHPDYANWAQSSFEVVEGGLTKNQCKAIQQYAKYLYCEPSAGAIYDAILWATIHAAQELAELGVKLLILPGFAEIPGVVGTLNYASSREFDSENTLKKYYNKTSDNRWNHFSEVNHQILADKVCDFFTDYKPVNLDVGFEENIYTRDNI